MRHNLLLCGIGIVGGVVGGSLLTVHQRHQEVETMEEILTFSPTAKSIQQRIASQPTASKSAREKIFSEMFTQRFRIHDLKMAVRVKFVDPDDPKRRVSRIRLMCPARTEPWNMDRLALATWHEAKTCLNEDCDIDIFETFIGALPRKIGELRTTTGDHPTAHIEVVSDLGKHYEHER